METKELNKTLDRFLNKKVITNVSLDGTEYKECNLETGECYTIKEADGIVERLNKTYITENGKQLLQD